MTIYCVGSANSANLKKLLSQQTTQQYQLYTQ